jgi:hypothetical protein
LGWVPRHEALDIIVAQALEWEARLWLDADRAGRAPLAAEHPAQHHP